MWRGRFRHDADFRLPPRSYDSVPCVAHDKHPRFHIPLIKPDVQISRIRLSDKTSRRRPRLLTPPCAQTYEPEVPVQVREWIAPALSLSEFVFEA